MGPRFGNQIKYPRLFVEKYYYKKHPYKILPQSSTPPLKGADVLIPVDAHYWGGRFTPGGKSEPWLQEGGGTLFGDGAFFFGRGRGVLN